MELIEQCNLLCVKIKETRQSIIDNVIGILKKHKVKEIDCYLTNTPSVNTDMTLDGISLTDDNELKLWCGNEDEIDYVFADELDIELLIDFYQWLLDYEDELFEQD